MSQWLADWEQAQQACEQGAWAEALAHFEKAAQLANRLPDEDPNKSDVLYGLGATLARLGQTARADAVLAQVLRLRIDVHGLGHPLVATTLYTQGEMYLRNSQWMEAQHALVMASELLGRMEIEDWPRFEVEFSLARTLKLTGHLDEAFRHLQVAGRLAGPNSPYRVALQELAAALAIGHGHYELAAQILTRLAEGYPAGPDQVDALGALADVLLASKQWEATVSTIDRALQQDPEQAALWRRKGVALSRSGQPAEAEICLLKAREIVFTARQKVEMTRLCADVQRRAQNWEAVAARLEESLGLLRRDPGRRAELRVALGQAYLRLGRPGDARREFLRAFKLRHRVARPPYVLMAEAMAGLGAANNRLGRTRQAEKSLNFALFLMESDLIPVEGLDEESLARGRELTLTILDELAQCLEAQQRFGEAAAGVEAVLRARQGDVDFSGDQGRKLLDRAIELYQKAGDEARADQVRQEFTAS